MNVPLVLFSNQTLFKFKKFYANKEIVLSLILWVTFKQLYNLIYYSY